MTWVFGVLGDFVCWNKRSPVPTAIKLRSLNHRATGATRVGKILAQLLTENSKTLVAPVALWLFKNFLT